MPSKQELTDLTNKIIEKGNGLVGQETFFAAANMNLSEGAGIDKIDTFLTSLRGRTSESSTTATNEPIDQEFINKLSAKISKALTESYNKCMDSLNIKTADLTDIRSESKKIAEAFSGYNNQEKQLKTILLVAKRALELQQQKDSPTPPTTGAIVTNAARTIGSNLFVRPFKEAGKFMSGGEFYGALDLLRPMFAIPQFIGNVLMGVPYGIYALRGGMEKQSDRDFQDGMKELLGNKFIPAQPGAANAQSAPQPKFTPDRILEKNTQGLIDELGELNKSIGSKGLTTATRDYFSDALKYKIQLEDAIDRGNPDVNKYSVLTPEKIFAIQSFIKEAKAELAQEQNANTVLSRSGPPVINSHRHSDETIFSELRKQNQNPPSTAPQEPTNTTQRPNRPP